MKKLFKNRYFSFLMIYLCFLSIVGTSISFSKFLTQDSSEEAARAAIYNVEIYSGNSDTVEQDILMEIYATSKISETTSMIAGTYEYKQINIINKSECDISLSDYLIDDDENSIYSKLVIPMTAEEMAAYEQSKGSVPMVILDYLGKTETELSLLSVAELKSLIDEKNTTSFEQLCKTLKPNKISTFFIISWVEHDAVYKEDADNNADSDGISHKTPTELGLSAEFFKIQIHSEQVD